MGSAAFKASTPKASASAAGSTSQSGRSDADTRLNYVMGEDRAAVGLNDTNAASDMVAIRVNELANRMDEALHFKSPTRASRSGKRKLAKTKTERLSKSFPGSTPSPSQPLTQPNSWRERVKAAKQHAAATLSIVRLLDSNLARKMRNYYDFVPPAIEEALDSDWRKFIAEYAKVKQVLDDVKEAQSIKNNIATLAAVKTAKTGSGRNRAEVSDLLRKTGVNKDALFATQNSVEARKFAKNAVLETIQSERDDRDGVELRDARVHGSLTLLQTYLSRANEIDDIDHKGEEVEGDQSPAQNPPPPLKNPLTQSQDAWVKNPKNKLEVLRMTAEAKSGARAGKVAVLIFAADLGPERHGGERQPLWATEPYEMLAEIHEEQRYKEYLEKAAVLKRTTDEAVARGEAEESTEAEFPVQVPTSTTLSTTHVEGMHVGARLMTQLVADILDTCGPKAIESIKVVLVVSDATESIIIKDMLANDFYGLKQENVLFVNQPDLPGFRYVPEINLFREDSSARSARYGSGYVMEQLASPGEAFLISANMSARGYLVESALDHLSSFGVEWIFKSHSRLIPKEMFDINLMAHCLALKERFDANMISEVVETSMHTSRKWGNIAAARSPNSKAEHEAGTAYFTRIIGSENISTSEAQQAVVDMFEESKAKDENKTLYSATGRWMLVLADLQKALDEIRFTPTFCLGYELEEEARLTRLKSIPAVYPQVYAHDLTLVDKIRPLSICVDPEACPRDIVKVNVSDPIGLIRYISKVQDGNMGFQSRVKEAARVAKAKGADAPNLVMMSTGSAKRHVLVVGISENQTCQTVLELVNSLVIPGIDEIHLIHICKNPDLAARAHKMLSQFDIKSVVQLTRHVLILAPGVSIPDMLTERAQELKATLLVIASEKLDRTGEPKMGSVAITLCRKNLFCSVLIVKSHSTAAKNSTLGLSYVVGVDVAALDMFEWVCTLARSGKDKICVANCSGMGNTAGMVRSTNSATNIVQKFKDKAVSRGFMPVGRLVDGKPSVELPQLAHHLQADIVVVSASKKSGEVSKGTTAILKDPLTSALLIYRPPEEGRATW